MNDERDEREERDARGERDVGGGGGVSAGPAVAVDIPEEPDHGQLTATTGRRIGGRELAMSLLFLLPALIFLLGWLVYPVLFTVWRSLFDAAGDQFVGADNYREMFSNNSTRTAIKNNLVWVVSAPTLAAAVGLVFAVLTERIRFGTAFKVVIFMPMAISFLAAGVIFRFVYDQNPDRGLANALITTVSDLWQSPGQYQGARPADSELFESTQDAYVTTRAFSTGTRADLGVVAVRPGRVPDDAAPATEAARAPPDAITGTVWLDFSPGGVGDRGVIDPQEVGLPGMKVEAIGPDGDMAGSATADENGTFALEGLDPGDYQLRLASSNFAAPWTGYNWLGPSLVTPSVIGSFLWIWTGYALVVIAAGLAAVPRETMEAARVDGANEWQVFRRVTAPLLWPVILVVVVTLVINVLKIFDLVLVVPPGNVQDDANVIALELWRVSFGGARHHGLGSALGVFLFALVLPAMAFNIRRFRAEQD